MPRRPDKDTRPVRVGDRYRAVEASRLYEVRAIIGHPVYGWASVYSVSRGLRVVTCCYLLHKQFELDRAGAGGGEGQQGAAQTSPATGATKGNPS